MDRNYKAIKTNGTRDVSFLLSDFVQEPSRKREKDELVLVALRLRARANYVIMRDRVDNSNEPAALRNVLVL